MFVRESVENKTVQHVGAESDLVIVIPWWDGESNTYGFVISGWNGNVFFIKMKTKQRKWV
jgi:hypothetical protein